MTSKHASALAIGLMLAGGSASALEPACETYLRAAEKSAGQASRHTVTEAGGVRLELVVTGGQAYTRFDGGKWQPVKRGGKAYIGADGLVYGQRSSEAVVRHRYTGVTAPKS